MRNFDAETVRLLGVAFEMAIESLRNRGVDEQPREAIARAIIDLAKAGERDPERLCELALEACSLMVTAPNPFRLSLHRRSLWVLELEPVRRTS
jgi:hypothetical protein